MASSRVSLYSLYSYPSSINKLLCIKSHLCDLFPDIKEMKGWKKIEEKKSPFSLKVEEYEEWGFYRKKISLNAHFFLWLLRRAIHNFDLNIVWHFLHLCSMLRFFPVFLYQRCMYDKCISWPLQTCHGQRDSRIEK